MKVRRSSSGFVLVFSLVLALCVGVILAATLGYVSFAARQSAISAARSSSLIRVDLGSNCRA